MAILKIPDRCAICGARFTPGNRIVVMRGATTTTDNAGWYSGGANIKPGQLRVMYTRNYNPKLGICTRCWNDIVDRLDMDRHHMIEEDR